MPSDAQKRADRKYKREKTNQVCLRFYPADSEIWAYLRTQDNRQGFIKGLIHREMKTHPADVATSQMPDNQSASNEGEPMPGKTRRTQC